MAVSDAQKRAKKKYEEKNKARTNYLSYRSTTKSFVSKLATNEDLDNIEELIKIRRVMLDGLDDNGDIL